VLATHLLQAGIEMSEGESLRNPPIDGNMRQQKPWEALGMSRATYYRHGKPAADNRDFFCQAARARMVSASTRTIQREDFIKRYGIPELGKLVLQDHFLTAGMISEVAKWHPEDQRTFFDSFMLLVADAPKIKPPDREFSARQPITAALIEVGKPMLRRLAKQLFAVCKADMVATICAGVRFTEDSGIVPPKKSGD
jgi:hypothetical protein